MRKSIEQSMKRYKWVRFLRRPNTLFFSSIRIPAYREILPSLIGIGIPTFAHIASRGVVDIFHPEAELKRFKRRMLFLYRSKKRLSRLLAECEHALINIKRTKARRGTVTARHFAQDCWDYSRYFAHLTIIPYAIGEIIETSGHLHSVNGRRLFHRLAPFRDAEIYRSFHEQRILPVIHAASTVLGYEPALLEQMTASEITAVLNGRMMIENELRRRQANYVYVSIDHRELTTTDPHRRQSISRCLPFEAAQAETGFIGQVAFSGRVYGTVKVIQYARHLAKFKRGDILVSSSTNPELLPAMRQAAAIVTDEGGLISHAAIIARELHIPCVVGTKKASQVLHDGDRIIVDAFKGIISKRS